MVGHFLIFSAYGSYNRSACSGILVHPCIQPLRTQLEEDLYHL